MLVLFNAALYDLLPPAQPVPAFAPAPAFHLEFDRGMIGMTGWHRPGRSHDGVTYQWTSAQTATMRLPLTGRSPRTLEIMVINAVTAEMYDSLRVRVNGVDVPLEREGGFYRGVILASMLNEGDTLIALETAPPVRPVDYGGTDARLLGVAVDWLTIGPG